MFAAHLVFFHGKKAHDLEGAGSAAVEHEKVFGRH
jgi:hypothetical protein